MPSIVYVPCLPKGDQSNVMLRKDVSSHIFYIAKNLCHHISSTPILGNSVVEVKKRLNTK